MLLINDFRHNDIKEKERSVETDLVPWIKKNDGDRDSPDRYIDRLIYWRFY